MKVVTSLFFSLVISLLARDNYGVETRNFTVNNFNSSIVNPLTTEKDFSTRDGSKTFRANIACNESVYPFINISYSGASDIALNVQIDKNLDGSFDNSYLISGVSGIGANGVIKCNPNSWNNCKYYKYSYNGGNLSLDEIQRKDLGGAVCVNSSCGSPSQSNRKDLLENIGSVISILVARSYTNYSISRYENTSERIIYYAQSLKECSNFKDDKYSSGEDGISEASDALIIEPDGLYSVVLTGTENYNTNKPDDTEFDEMKKRVQKRDTANFDKSSQQFTYDDTRKEKGVWVAESDGCQFDIDLSDLGVKFCQVTWQENVNEVFSDTSNRSETVSGSSVAKFDIRECMGTDFSVCPVITSKGESIKYPCGEVDNMNEVIGGLSAVAEATEDIICSKN